MPLKLEIKKKLSTRSERVKSVELHPTQPWVLCGLYSGNLVIYDYNSQVAMRQFEVSNSPIRACRFIVRKQWIISGSDDMQIRVFNYNTMDKIKQFEGHQDYIRSILIHPTLPYMLTASDDCTVKLWDWESNWTNIKTYEGHSHYIMSMAINPKDHNSFATASLDATIKVWGISGSEAPHFTLTGHLQGINCVEYFRGGDRPYLVSGGDDFLIKIWDYQTKLCAQTLKGHKSNISTLIFHPELPLIISGSEDGSVKMWHSSTFRQEHTLNYGLERVWSLHAQPGSKLLAIGCDEGTLVLKLGSDEPIASMATNGKVVWIKGNTVFTSRIAEDSKEGETIQLPNKELGTCEIYPSYLKHSPNGRSIAVCGDGEWVIYSSQAFRNQAYGQGLELVWSNAGDFAVRDSYKVKIFKSGQTQKEHLSFRPQFLSEGIFGGALLGLRSDEFICLYDWEYGKLVRRIDACPKNVFWSDDNKLLALLLEECFYILSYNEEMVKKMIATWEPEGEEDIEEAFATEQEVFEVCTSGLWVGQCFVYTNDHLKLNYCVGGKVMTLCHLDKKLYLIGYLSAQNNLVLIDNEFKVVLYKFHQSLIQYQTAIVREDFEKAEEIFSQLPRETYNKVAKFLDAQGYKEQAFDITEDIEHKFELALSLNKLNEAFELAADNFHKLKLVGDFALLTGSLNLAENCFLQVQDCNALLMLYSSIGNKEKMLELGVLALNLKRYNVAFTAYFSCRDVENCLKVLLESKRYAEAAFFCRTYLPSKLSSVVDTWKEQTKLKQLCDPTKYPEKFPEIINAIQKEQIYAQELESASNFENAYNLLKAGKIQ